MQVRRSEFGEYLKNSSYTLLFHIFGDFLYVGTNPSLTEAHILETILEFQRDLEEEQRNKSRNKFSTFLKDKSFLFIGCGYDDWLFRLLIRGVVNEEYLLQQNPHPNKFISDDFLNNKKDPFNELSTFLKNFRSEVYYLCNGKEFVDVLFKKLEGDHRDQLIPLPGCPGKVFISFIRANESAAKKLAANLKEEGVDVWLEDIEPGAPVDKEINKTIAECPFFIPLISSESKSLDSGNGKLRYHIREWEWAYSNHINDRNPKRIIPVKMEDINWMYDKFDNFSFVTIPGGDKENEDYKKLINKLKEPLI